ncbi:hypothetical protein PVAG01_01167 [Phlyctema vagabunda]|uniref:Mitochondrial resolvase Ydc2 catalytic domain-containing protein n=1 Tax=Phlyctema vagabunda TaxID=108571 RepID=A0ABR4PWV9_9HELO
MALKPPPGLKLAQLKAVAFKCGIGSSGSKTVLAQRLIDEGRPVIGHGPTRILSIDMGIRNLAYCLLDLPARASKKKPGVIAWKRLNVSTTVSPTAPATVQTSIGDETDVPMEKESFTPAALSAAAYDLLRNQLIPLDPAYILIERQRFRSMSSPHVLEWTIRINMFESILYGVLCTLKGEGLWNGEVIPITPMRVGPYWFPKDEVVEDADDSQRLELRKVRKTANKKLLNKGRKIDLVRNWLENREMVDLMTNEAKATAKSYVDKWDGQRRKKATPLKDGEDNLAKLDDLADSLLQGMAWIQWDEHKRITTKYGALALLDK